MNNYLLSIMKGRQKGLQPFLIIGLLWPFSLIYRIGVFFHHTYFRLIGAYKAPKPVISIGNIVVGGTGKTPLVIWLARHLQDKGFKSIILIRGYMPKSGKDSDEVDMINEQIPYIPVLTGPNRVRHIQMAEDILPGDVYICDDAFQHWPLYRDLDIVAIDASNPFGNGLLLPAGILREPLSALKRADVFILTKTDGASNVQDLSKLLAMINPQALILESRFRSPGLVDVFEGKSLPEGFLEGKPVVGFCAIGDPLSFESSLENSGAKVLKLFTYRDHHVYKKEDIKQMMSFCRSQGVKVLVTTHKDAVKLQVFKDAFTGLSLVYIPIQLEITKGYDEFFKKVITVCFS